ncbi:isoaspartyl peptidase/L-asparaginase [Halostella salina]|uniref:isoaspartyl peptidase/L-asparaginase n=1 Tax=Halostella salina TaxID=1547897 RepID=UPI000EF7BB63|nr:isoaspartyl peptidase/L-asparaginase [Halostella salina]
MQVIVHGGAGASPDDPEARQAVLDEAAATGVGAGSPLDAVTAAVRVLESNPRFNAGVGGAVQSDGAIRTDAGLMTDDRAVGAVASLPGVEHAVSAARVVLEETPHVLVSGQQGVDLAADYGVETDCDLWTERTRDRWAEVDPPEGGPAEHLGWLRDRFGSTDADGRDAGGDGTDHDADGRGPSSRDPSDHDTVGAVARAGDRLAAATSTGGRWLALAGRVGDVPQVGSGFYCAPAGGASATGAGEDIARVTLARRAVRRLERGDDAAAAADAAIETFGEITGSDAGVIVLGRDGSVGSAFNSDAMQTATAKE